MSQYLEVSFLNKPLGILAWNRETREGQFEFLPGFIENDQEISPVAYPKELLLNQPPVCNFTTSIDIPPFFADCLPGNYANRLLRYALQGSGKSPESLSPLSIFSLLGKRGVGAYGFEPHGYPELDESEPVEIDRIVRSLHQLYQAGSRDISEKRLRELLRCGLFTTGSDPEIFLAINDYNGEVISGQGNIPKGFEAWILKLDGVLISGTQAIKQEYAHYKKAIDCGIEMAQCRLMKEGSHTHLLVRRVDRILGERVHVQSFRALREKPVDSYEAVFRCMRQLRFQYPDFIQLYKRMIFNVLTGNTGETGRNILFTCHHGNEWHLAPATGLAPTPWILNHALSVCGKNSKIQAEDLIRFGKLQNIRKCGSIVEKIKISIST